MGAAAGRIPAAAVSITSPAGGVVLGGAQRAAALRLQAVDLLPELIQADAGRPGAIDDSISSRARAMPAAASPARMIISAAHCCAGGPGFKPSAQQQLAWTLHLLPFFMYAHTR